MAAVQFAVQPQFGHLALADHASVEDAVRIVMNARKRSDHSGADKVVSKIAQQTGSTTVADLRRLTDTDWRVLDVPAICRIYLKYLVRQAARGGPLAPSSASAAPAVAPRRDSVDPFMEQLQNDFNSGNPFDMSLYSHSLTMLASMGFKRDEAMEALCIIENKSVEAALEVLFSDPATRKRRRQEAVDRLGRQVSGSPQNASSSSTEIISLRSQLERERTSRIHAEVELKSYLDNLNRMNYREYIMGLIADEIINVSEFEQLKVYRDKKKISQADHIQILQELGLTERSFESMKKFEAKRENECIVCLDKPKNHVIMNCMHLCVCEDCVPTLQKKKTCPLCNKKITQVIKIFT